YPLARRSVESSSRLSNPTCSIPRLFPIATGETAMKPVFSASALAALFLVVSPLAALAGDNEPPEGFKALFNGSDLSGWKVPEGDGGHWKVVDGVIDYDAESESKGDSKDLWSEREFTDFVLLVDWRLKEAPYINPNVPYILPDGTHARDVQGKE